MVKIYDEVTGIRATGTAADLGTATTTVPAGTIVDIGSASATAGSSGSGGSGTAGSAGPASSSSSVQVSPVHHGALAAGDDVAVSG